MQREGVWNARAEVASVDGRFTAYRLSDTTVVRMRWGTSNVVDTFSVPRMRKAPSLAFVGSRLYVATVASGFRYIDTAGALQNVQIVGKTITFESSGTWYGLKDLWTRGIYGFPGCGYLVLATGYTMGGQATNERTTGDVCFIDTLDHAVKHIVHVGDPKGIFSGANGNEIAISTNIRGIWHVPRDPDDDYSNDFLHEFDVKNGVIRYSVQLDADLFNKKLIDRYPVVPIGRPGLMYIDTVLYSIAAKSSLNVADRPDRVLCGLSAKRTLLGVDAIDDGVVIRTFDVAGGASLIVDTLIGATADKLTGWASQPAGVCYVVDQQHGFTYRYRFSDLQTGDTASVHHRHQRVKLYSLINLNAVGITPWDPGKYIFYINGKPDTSLTPSITRRVTDTGLITIGVKIVSNRTSQYFSAMGDPITVYRPDSIVQDYLVDAGQIQTISVAGDLIATSHRTYTSAGRLSSSPCTKCYQPIFFLKHPSMTSFVDSSEFIYTIREVRWDDIGHHVYRSPLTLDTNAKAGGFTTALGKKSIEGYGLVPLPMAEQGVFWKDPSNGRIRAAVRVWDDWTGGSDPSIIVEMIDSIPSPVWNTLFTTGDYAVRNQWGWSYPEMFDVDPRFPNEVLVTMSTQLAGFTSSFGRSLFVIPFEPNHREWGAFRRDRTTIVTTQSVYELTDGVWAKTHSWPFRDGYKIIRLNDSYSFILKQQPDTVGYVVNHDERTVVQTLGQGFGEPTCVAYEPETSRIYIGDKNGSVAAFRLHVPDDPISSIPQSLQEIQRPILVEMRHGTITASGSDEIRGIEIFDLLGHRLDEQWSSASQLTMSVDVTHLMSNRPIAVVIHTSHGPFRHLLYLAN
ncbi:MAG: hypothetical protein EHM43_02225 [Ignavibacteriae bacterium]|nr:MAG: hypothetical protein EHM43_02225 [Ignavibacteriota bacterium]